MKILTFDIEDWFHILDHEPTNDIKKWDNFEKRVDIGLNIILDLLEKYKISASFFVVGWIANRYPHLVKKIDKHGHEIGSHTHLHQLVYTQEEKIFKNDVEKSIKTIEDIIGKKVLNFRAPGFSIGEKNLWAFNVLCNLGIKFDSSVFPANRAHGGYNNFKSNIPLIIKNNGRIIKEFPVNYFSLFTKKIIFTGGGYFRLHNYRFIKTLTSKSEYIMAYFHPRDFDADQPIIEGLSKWRRFKCYVGIKNCKNKLDKWLRDFDFMDINSADKIIDWSKATIIHI